MNRNRTPNADRETVGQLFDDIKQFDEILSDAEREASHATEIDFVAGVRARYDRFGTQLFLSVKQLNWLRRIAKAI